MPKGVYHRKNGKTKKAPRRRKVQNVKLVAALVRTDRIGRVWFHLMDNGQ